jgi:Tfp pilus assembly protein PilZ
MLELDSQKNRYAVTMRLFNYINDLSLERQFILYKQLIKDNVTSELLKLIIDMSGDEKDQLLQQLEDVFDEDKSVRTLNLDDDESFMRGNARKTCLIPVAYKVEDRSFKSYIIDISAVGVFIESKDLYPIGRKITMSLTLPNHHQALQLKGRVARSGAQGIGVKFDDLKPAQQTLIQKYIES